MGSQMKKKWIALLCAVMMVFGAACAFAESTPQPDGGKKFEGDWAVPGGLVEITYEEEGYRVFVNIEGEGTGTVWEYNCFYDAEKDALASFTSIRTDYTLNPDTGDETYQENTYEGIDEEGQITEFAIDGKGFLIWKDARENAGEGLAFLSIGNFEGLWRNDAKETEVTFGWNGLDDPDMLCYTVYITAGSADAKENTITVLNGSFDPETGKLTAIGTTTRLTKNADGDYDAEDDGETVEAVFSDAGNGTLLWENENMELVYDILGSEG